jgi:fructokinase
VCLLGRGPDEILAEALIPTADPVATLARINSVIDDWTRQSGEPAAIGVASFGPLDLRPDSRTFGYITSGAKRGWRGIDVAGTIARERGLPVAVNTDVNAAVLAESRWGPARGLSDLAYVTVGTGVGVGLLVGGRLAGGCTHPELGHIRIARLAGDTWPGICPYHGDCVEGLASGPAIAARASKLGEAVPEDSPIWEPVAHALAQLAHTLVLATAPRRILLGGGVMEGQHHLFRRIRSFLAKSLNGYLDLDNLTGGLDQYLLPSGLGGRVGPLGSLALAQDAARSALS